MAGERIGNGEGVPEFGAAADGDADRNMILGTSACRGELGESNREPRLLSFNEFTVCPCWLL